MGHQKNTITLNGNIYNAKTGAVIDGLSKMANDAPNRHLISDFGRGSNSHYIKQPIKVAIRKTTAHLHKVASAARDKHHSPEHTKTLMRSIVKKPVLSSTSTKQNPKPSKKHLSLPAEQINAKRAEHAKIIPKSTLISRFNTPAFNTAKFIKKTAHISVKQPPSSDISHHQSSPISDIALKATPIEDLFNNALGNAKSHELTSSKHNKKGLYKSARAKTRSKVVNVGASVLAVVILGGFFAYQNGPNISMRLAVAKTGVHASLPSYKPTGFSLNRSVQTSPGSIVISFHSNSDSRNFSIAQSTSNWNSDTLEDNFLASSQKPYQRISTTNGKTVYVYDDTNATWVDGGIWYKIEGDSSLSSSQLLKIASSF